MVIVRVCFVTFFCNGQIIPADYLSDRPRWDLPRISHFSVVRPKKKLLHFIDVTREEDVPYHWKKAEIIHFLQEGKDYTATESYRPITITSVCCKLAERMVVHLLSKHTKTGSFQEK